MLFDVEVEMISQTMLPYWSFLDINVNINATLNHMFSVMNQNDEFRARNKRILFLCSRGVIS